MSKYLKKNLGGVFEEGYDVEMCEVWIKDEDVVKLWTGNTKKMDVEVRRERPDDLDGWCWFGLMSEFPYEDV